MATRSSKRIQTTQTTKTTIPKRKIIRKVPKPKKPNVEPELPGTNEIWLNRMGLEPSLKSTKCKKLVFSPVISCPGGHKFCGLCGIGLENCKHGGCKEEPLSPCDIAETLLRSTEATLRCKNGIAGCQKMLKAWELKKHLESCEFRPIECCEKHPSNYDCQGKICSLDEYLEHLKQDHLAENMQLKERSEGCIEFTTHLGIEEAHGNEFHRGEIVYFLYDKQTFISHMVRENGVSFWWITLIGPEEEAAKYRYVLKFKGKDDPSAPKFQWENLPVYSVRFCDFEKVKDVGGVASYHFQSIKCYADGGFRGDVHHDYLWAVKIQIKKVNHAKRTRTDGRFNERVNGTSAHCED